MAKQTNPRLQELLAPRFQGDRVVLAGRFDKWDACSRERLEHIIKEEGGMLVENLDATVSLLVMKEPTGATTHEKKVAKLNDAGASIQVWSGDEVLSRVEPTDEVIDQLLHGGSPGHERLARLFRLLELDGQGVSNDDPPLHTTRALSLRGMDLTDIPLWTACHEDADFRETTRPHPLRQTQSHQVIGPLRNCKLSKAQLEVSFCALVDCDCRNSDFTGSWMHGFRVRAPVHSDFTNATLVEFHFEDCDLSGSVFARANLTRAELENAVVKDASLKGACLKSLQGKKADFTGSDCSKADFSDADLMGAKFDGCNLAGASFRGAVLMNGSMKGAILKGADFTNANVANVNFEGADTTRVKGLSLSNRNLVAGPRLQELAKQVSKAVSFKTTIEVQSHKEPIRLTAWRSGCNWSRDLWATTLSDWDQRASTLEDAMIAAVSCWPHATPQPHTVVVEGKKLGMTKPKITQLAREAWCETFGIAGPSEEQLKQGAAAAEEEKNQIRAVMLADLDGPVGIAKWNKRDHLELLTIESFPNADLSGRDLTGVRLESLKFDNADFTGTNLNESDLDFGSYANASFRKARMELMHARYSDFTNCDFSHAQLQLSGFERANFAGAKFDKASLDQVYMENADLRGADFSRARFGKEPSWYVGQALFDEHTKFPKGFAIPAEMIWKGKGFDPRAEKAIAQAKSAGPIDFEQFMEILAASVDQSRLKKVMKMLKAEAFQLFAQVENDSVTGVVKSQTDPDLVYSCRLDSGGTFACCTQNLNPCGGLRGALCKHLLVLIVGLTKGDELDPTTINAWVAASKLQSPQLDKDLMSEVFLKYKGAEAGEIDWRPTETVPEDFYAF
jgi:uncharacterized protein YjbI with pentapeptide repeats